MDKENLKNELSCLMGILDKNRPEQFDGSLGSIYKIVLQEFNASSDSSTRKDDVRIPRQVAQAIALTLLRFKRYSYSLERIGKEMGDRHHATVLHSGKVVSNFLNQGYYNNIISVCASKCGLTLEDLVINGRVRPQRFIEAYKDDQFVERFIDDKQASKYFGVSLSRIQEVLSNQWMRVNKHKLIIKRHEY